jgi:hypothetical protein
MANRRVLASDDINKSDTAFGWRPGLGSGDSHPAGFGLHHEVISRALAVRAESRNRCTRLVLDLTPVERLYRAHSEPVRPEEVVDDNIGLRHEASDNREILIPPQSSATDSLLRLVLRK